MTEYDPLVASAVENRLQYYRELGRSLCERIKGTHTKEVSQFQQHTQETDRVKSDRKRHRASRVSLKQKKRVHEEDMLFYKSLYSIHADTHNSPSDQYTKSVKRSRENRHMVSYLGMSDWQNKPLIQLKKSEDDCANLPCINEQNRNYNQNLLRRFNKYVQNIDV